MKSLFFVTLSAFFLTYGTAECGDSKENTQKLSEQKKEIAKISEAFGHLIGKNLEAIGVELDIQSVVKGLKDSAEGKSSPMTESECIQAITIAQENIFAEMAEKNKAQADEFLQKNSAESGIISLENGKVQYKVLQEGQGECLKEGDSPLIQYVGKFLDGSVFGESKEPEPFSLDEVISGLRAGLLGMKEGEKRTIFIHPDQAYGTRGSLPPNSLLTFEIELIKTQAPLLSKDSLDLFPSTSEVALPDQPLENIR